MTRSELTSMWGVAPKRGPRLPSVILTIWIVLVSALSLLPIAVLLISSFSNESFLRFPPQLFGVAGYVAALGNPAFWASFGLSVAVAVIVTAVSAIFGIMAAYALTRLTSRGGLLGTALLAPLSVPGILIGVGLLQVFVVAQIPVAPGAILLGHLTVSLPFMVSFVIAGFRGSSIRLEWASESLGASKWRAFRTVMFPVIAPSVLGGAIFAFLHSFDEANISLFVSQGDWTTLPVKILHDTTDNPTLGAVESGVMIVIAVLAIGFLQLRFGFLTLLLSRNGAGRE